MAKSRAVRKLDQMRATSFTDLPNVNRVASTTGLALPPGTIAFSSILRFLFALCQGSLYKGSSVTGLVRDRGEKQRHLPPQG